MFADTTNTHNNRRPLLLSLTTISADVGATISRCCCCRLSHLHRINRCYPRIRFYCSVPAFASTAASPPSLPLQRPRLRFHCSVIAVFAAAYTSLRHPNQTLAPSKRPARRYNGTCAQDILRTTAYANAAQRHHPPDDAITNVTTAGTNKPTPQSHSCRQNKQ